MKSITTRPDSSQSVADTAVYLFDDWFDPIEAAVRDRVRGFIQAMVEGELDATLLRPRYGRRPKSSDGNKDGLVAVIGHRHGHRTRSLTGTFGRTEIAVPRARLVGPDGGTSEWKSKVLRAYQRRTLAADALIASAYLAGTNTRRVRRALKALFADGVGKDVVSRVWRKVRSDWEAWNTRSLVEEPIVRLILDGTVVRVRLDRKATSISLLVVIGVREDGQKVLLALKNMGGEITADYTDMIYAATPEAIAARRTAFIRKWRLRHRAVADSLEEAGDRLFTFTRLPPTQWRSARTTNAIERLHEEFKRRIKTQTVLPSADTAAMLFWALLASGQINMRKVDGWKTLATKPIDQPIDLAA